MKKGNGFRMFEGKQCHRGLMPVAVALVMAMAVAFGLAATSVAADPAKEDVSGFLNEQKVKLTVTDVEKGVTGTAYRYVYANWNTSENVPTAPEYLFEAPAAKWMMEKIRGGDLFFKPYVRDKGTDSYPTAKFKKLRAGGMRDFSDKLLAAIMKSEVVLTNDEIAHSKSEGDGTSISFDLAMGGYLIALSNGTSRVYQPIATFVKPKLKEDRKTYELEIDQVSATASSKIEAKSKEITSTKKVNRKPKTHSQIGDELNFIIKTPIPNYPANANKKFGVRDYPDPGLTINPDSIKVKIENEDEIDGSNYSVKKLEVTANGNHGSRGQGFMVEFDKTQYESKLASAGRRGRKLVVTYTGTLNDKAPIKDGTKNSAHPLIPKDNYKSEVEYTTPAPTVTTIYTYGLKITKVGKARKGSKPNPKLPGAKFKLYKKSSKKNDAEVKVKKVDGVAGAGSAAATSKYIVDPKGSDTITSGPNGLLLIDGLGAGVYRLEETKAPEGGYALPAGLIRIEIKDENLDGKPDGSKIGDKAASVDPEDNRLIYDLTNKKANFKLPKTGAIGAVIFGVVGVALIVTSAAFVVAHRRRKAKRSS